MVYNKNNKGHSTPHVNIAHRANLNRHHKWFVIHIQLTCTAHAMTGTFTSLTGNVVMFNSALNHHEAALKHHLNDHTRTIIKICKKYNIPLFKENALLLTKVPYNIKSNMLMFSSPNDKYLVAPSIVGSFSDMTFWYYAWVKHVVLRFNCYR